MKEMGRRGVRDEDSSKGGLRRRWLTFDVILQPFFFFLRSCWLCCLINYFCVVLKCAWETSTFEHGATVVDVVGRKLPNKSRGGAVSRFGSGARGRVK